MEAEGGHLVQPLVPGVAPVPVERAWLRRDRPAGLPLLTEAAAMITAYLTAERELGRIAADADVETLAPTLIGGGHLLFADRNGAPPEAEAVRKTVATVLAGVLREPRS